MRQTAHCSQLFTAFLLAAVLPSLAAAGPRPVSEQKCVNLAYPDPVLGATAAYAMWLPGIGQDFIFDPAKPAEFSEYGDGTATFTGVARRRSAPAEGFRITVVLAGSTTQPPVGSPKRELANAAYSDHGGPIEPAGWHYYTAFSGSLVGVDEYAGARLELEQRGPAFQVGAGANGKNRNYGGSTWLDWTVVSQPIQGHFQSQGGGDFSLDFDLCERICVARVVPDLGTPQGSAGPFAVTLDGLSSDLRLADGELVIYPRGNTLVAPHAWVTGILRSTADSNSGLELEWLLSDRVEAKVDSEHSGRMDPAAMHFYRKLSGQLIGFGSFAGAEFELELYGAAFQAGLGASGIHSGFGLSGRFSYRVLQHSPAMSLLPAGYGEGRLGECPAVAH